jgi:pimeloyl-ACP methyl ester carboxylesterase
MLADGRRLCWQEAGAPNGRPIIALHGTPGSRLKYMGADDQARTRGLRLICPDRWGYGLSSAPRTPSLTAYASDVAALAAHLSLDRFGLVGVSGGGPFAAAVAAALPERVTRLALIAPVGPIEAGTDLRLFHRLCFQWVPRRPGALEIIFGLYRLALLAAPGHAVRLAAAVARGSDRALMREPDVRNRLAETFRTGLARQIAGGVIDIRLFSKAWDFNCATIATPTRIWMGDEDRNVPLVAALRLARRIPESEMTLLEGEGHFWISRNYDDVLSWLAVAD